VCHLQILVHRRPAEHRAPRRGARWPDSSTDHAHVGAQHLRCTARKRPSPKETQRCISAAAPRGSADSDYGLPTATAPPTTCGRDQTKPNQRGTRTGGNLRYAPWAVCDGVRRTAQPQPIKSVCCPNKQGFKLLAPPCPPGCSVHFKRDMTLCAPLHFTTGTGRHRGQRERRTWKP
jgi:hypothetical protein